MKRRVTLWGACFSVAAIAVMVAAPAAMAAKVVLKVAHAWDSVRLPAQTAFDKYFMAKYPNIAIKAQNTDWGGYRDKMLSRLAAGDSPDIMYTTGCWTQMWMTKGIMRDITPYIKGQRNFDIGDFSAVSLKKYMLGGKYFFIPYAWSPMPVYYNVDMFSRSGLDYPAIEGFDLDKLTELSHKLSKDTNGDGKPDTFGWELMLTGWWPLDGYLASFGGKLLAPDEKTMTVNGPNAVKALEFWLDMVRNKKIATNTWDGLESGKAAMTSTKGSWDVPLLTQKIGKKFKWDVGYWPAGPSGRTTTAESSGYGITLASKHPKEAWIYLNEYMSTEGQRMMRTAFGPDASRKTARTADFPGAPAHFSRVFDMIDDYAIDAIATPLMDYIWPTISRELGDVWASKKSVKQATDKIKAEGDNILRTRRFK